MEWFAAILVGLVACTAYLSLRVHHLGGVIDIYSKAMAIELEKLRSAHCVINDTLADLIRTVEDNRRLESEQRRALASANEQSFADLSNVVATHGDRLVTLEIHQETNSIAIEGHGERLIQLEIAPKATTPDKPKEPVDPGGSWTRKKARLESDKATVSL